MPSWSWFINNKNMQDSAWLQKASMTVNSGSCEGGRVNPVLQTGLGSGGVQGGPRILWGREVSHLFCSSAVQPKTPG